MTYELHRHDALKVSELLEPASVDLLVTSPPYFALRSYQDGGEHYDGQIGSEASPSEFVDALIACTRDWVKVMKPGGSMFVNLGDKMAGSGGHNNNGLGSSTLKHDGRLAPRPDTERQQALKATRRNAPDRYNQTSDGIPRKSLMGLPWRYAIRCVDELGLTLRAEIVWDKPNGLPESVTDRVRRSHEQWFHLTLGPTYFAAIDEVREAQTSLEHHERYNNYDFRKQTVARGGIAEAGTGSSMNPLGKVPGSVWRIPSEPLRVPDWAGIDVDHFAAFPTEWPRRLILGWTPTGWCVECGEARRAVVEKELTNVWFEGGKPKDTKYAGNEDEHGSQWHQWDRQQYGSTAATITGYACHCPNLDAPTTPARVLDPFAGTGTTVAVAHHLGRHGIGTDLSNDYLHLAAWRCKSDVALRQKVQRRTNEDAQGSLFGGVA